MNKNYLMVIDMFQELLNEFKEYEQKKSKLFTDSEIQSLKEELAELSLDEEKFCIFVNNEDILLIKTYEGRSSSNIKATKVPRNANIEATWAEFNKNDRFECRIVIPNVTLNRSFDNETIIGNDTVIWSSLDFSKERELLMEQRDIERERIELSR